jgi:hypothetical protein
VLWSGTGPTVDSATLSHVTVGTAGAVGTGGAGTSNNGKAGTAAAVVQLQ